MPRTAPAPDCVPEDKRQPYMAEQHKAEVAAIAAAAVAAAAAAAGAGGEELAAASAVPRE